MPIDDGFLRRLRAIPEDLIVSELKKIHARKSDHRRPEAAPAVPAPAAETRYERARRVFAEEEKRLRQQARITDQVVDQLRSRETAPASRSSQETLLLRSAVGRQAAGRFRLANRFARTLAVDLAASSLRRRGDAVDVRCPIDVTPAHVVLDPGADQVVRVAIDLRAADPTVEAGAVLEAEVVARAEGARVHRLWIEVEVYAPTEDP